MKKMSKKEAKTAFKTHLLKWNREQNTRQMPWKGEKDPYKIWLSEIILQQTRVVQGLAYYNEFIRVFPEIRALAKAKDTVIYKLWEGLGYYTRCRNLIATARYIFKERKGRFPDSYEEIIALKGIGPYTAAAISSFAFGLPHAVVDGNVSRVLARIFGIDTPIDSTEGKKIFSLLAQELLDKKNPGPYNQAIMDFGAVICKPVTPSCPECPFNTTCYAFLNKKVQVLPVKEKKTAVRKRWFYYLVMEYRGQRIIRQRTGKDIWQQLFEFPLLETGKETGINDILKRSEKQGLIRPNDFDLLDISPLYKQQLSHQLIAGQFIRLRLKRKPSMRSGWFIAGKNIHAYAFPQFINQYLLQEARP
jgi:A/G-specific adenine glycosylase